MKLLLTCVSLDSERGAGTAERTRQLARALVAAGYQCSIATIDSGSLVKELTGIGASIYVTGSTRLKFTIPFVSPWRLWNLVRNAEVVHILGYWNLLSVLTAFFAFVGNRPFLLCAAGELALLNEPRHVAKLFHRLFGWLLLGKAAKIIAITELEKQQLLARFHFPADRVSVLPNGAIASNIALAETPAAESPATPYILFMGRLAHIKGPDLLVEAFGIVAPQYPEITLLLAGPDLGLQASLEARSRELGLNNRIRFLGFVNEQQRTELYRGASFLVVPSRAEAMSLVALEAGAAGIPVVATDQCGLSAIEEVDAGLICNCEVVSIAHALVIMLGSSQRRQQGRRWQAYVLRNYSWSAIADDLVAIAEHVK
ncbi:glycosyltransferase [Phyllobacterium sp. 21LDTY02-6]|uniref:glycosyltransferase n=1 Tax=Phyllobacterium sp. 21LDTY02-6 TaxID=2944903 RepID=UPI002022696B|nr:glycosyltransferase [Phyllobacterium sp. 21LDTY02-6]MCO4317108.1 glycosyltransferase [Phyllobacterium sp. 21LDTY02-6]